MSLIEWPERLGAQLTPRSRLEIQIELEGGATAASAGADLPRVVSIVPFGASWTQRTSAADL